MKRYETIMIIDPDLSEEQRSPFFDRLEELITGNNGLWIQNDQWGSKKLAYDIKKKPRGFYTRLDYCGTGALVDEMERVLRIDDRVLKYMTVLLEPNADLEKIKEQIAQTKLKAEEKTEPVVEAESPPEEEPPSESLATEEPPTESLVTEEPPPESLVTSEGENEPEPVDEESKREEQV